MLFQGYLPMKHEFDRGGYEVEIRSTYFEPGTADELLKVLLRWVDQDPHHQQRQTEEIAVARL